MKVGTSRPTRKLTNFPKTTYKENYFKNMSIFTRKAFVHKGYLGYGYPKGMSYKKTANTMI